MTDAPLVSLIVVSYRSVDLSLPLLAKLSEQDAPWPCEYIFVQEAEELSDEQMAAFPDEWSWVTVERGHGLCYNRNRAIEAARGEIIVFLDDDCNPPDGWLKAIVRPVLEGEADAAIGNVVVIGETYFGRAVAGLGHPGGGSLGFDRIYPVRADGSTDHLLDGNSAFNRKVFDSIGCFDEGLFLGCDTEMGLRMSKNGVRIRYCPEALVFHPSRETFKDFFFWSLTTGRASGGVSVRHPKRKGLKAMRTKNILKHSVAEGTLPLIVPLMFLSWAIERSGWLMERFRPLEDRR